MWLRAAQGHSNAKGVEAFLFPQSLGQSHKAGSAQGSSALRLGVLEPAGEKRLPPAVPKVGG